MSGANTPTYSVVVPVYNGAENLRELHVRLRDTLDQTGHRYEIIFVDDHSQDDSWQVLRELHALHPHVKALNLTRNFGQHAATLCGIAHTSGAMVITLDDDLQHPPEELPKLIQALVEDESTDVMIGIYDIKRHNWIRNVGSRVLARLNSAVPQRDPLLKLTSFRIMRRAVADNLLRFTKESPRIGQLILMSTQRVKNIQVRHAPRARGVSGYSWSRLTKDALDNIFSSSTAPLRFVVYVGLLSSLSSVLLVGFYLYRYFGQGISVSGWTTIIVTQLFLFGILFLSVGIIGEYLIRILREARKAPLYAVRERLD